MTRKLSVLIIEDNQKDAELSVNHLRKAGYDISYLCVDTADGMKTALINQKWDLILSDYSMPEFDVPSALAIYHESGADIPFIILSGAIGEEKAVEIIKAGAHDYLLKDNMTRFASVVERELREAIVRRDLIKANAALKTSEEKYRSYVEYAPDGVFVADENGKYLEVNRAATLITGYTENELLGMSLSDLLPPDNLAWGLDHFNSLRDNGFANGEGIFVHKDGTQRWWSVDTVILTNTRCLVFTKDITERKKFELEVIKANEQLELLNQYLVDAREDERALISRDLHDELGQALTALKLDLNWVRGNIRDVSNSSEKLNKMIEMTNEIIKKVQRISSELRPGLLDDLGLSSTIEWYCGEFEERTGIKCILAVEDLLLADPKNDLALFRILQEALTNVIRHSRASCVNIELHYSEQVITMIIDDNGIGMPFGKIESSNSLGLIGMRERARQCGGKVEFVTNEGNGTKIIISITRKENIFS
jgi:two-component system sensor histidine kinase UhpB